MAEIGAGTRGKLTIEVVINRGCRACSTPNPEGLPACSGCGAAMPAPERTVTVQELDLFPPVGGD